MTVRLISSQTIPAIADPSHERVRTVLTPALYRTVALASRSDLRPSQASGAFRATLLTFLAELSAVGGFPGDVQVLRRPEP